jgi:hypothetical protein
MDVKTASLLPRHSSTWSYVGWAGLYLFLGIYQLVGGKISPEFGEVFYIDFFINLVSPFVLAGGAFVVVQLDRGMKGVKWHEWFVFVVVFVVAIVIPAIVLFGVGGVPLFLSGLLFFLKLSWYGPAKEKGKTIALLFIRGIAGPFVFFAPALLISTLAVGRSTLTTDESDWVALFGVIYFLLQAVFEELLLRKAEKPDLITSEKLIQVQTPVDEGKE